jgi:hypothetical protein
MINLPTITTGTDTQNTTATNTRDTMLNQARNDFARNNADLDEHLTNHPDSPTTKALMPILTCTDAAFWANRRNDDLRNIARGIQTGAITLPTTETSA